MPQKIKLAGTAAWQEQPSIWAGGWAVDECQGAAVHIQQGPTRVLRADARRDENGPKTVADSIQLATGVLFTMTILPETKAALSLDMLATDLADYRMRKGVPFRNTPHHQRAGGGVGREGGHAHASFEQEAITGYR